MVWLRFLKSLKSPYPTEKKTDHELNTQKTKLTKLYTSVDQCLHRQ